MYWNKREEAVKANPEGMFYVVELEDISNGRLTGTWDQYWYDDREEAVKDAEASWRALSPEDKKKYQYNVSVEFFNEDGEMEEREDLTSFYYEEEKKPRHYDSEDPWYIIRGIMGSNCVKTDSDAGSLKVGLGNATMLIPNGYGDGTTRSAIVKTAYRSDDWQKIQNIMRFFTTIEGKLDIYDYDCGNDVMDTIEGKFEVYCYEGLIVFLEEEK